MKFFKSYWFIIIAAIISLIGLITGWYFFLFFLFPLGFFSFKNKDKDDDS